MLIFFTPMLSILGERKFLPCVVTFSNFACHIRKTDKSMKYSLALLLPFFLFAQIAMSQTESTKFWTLEECIEYALAKSLDVQGGVLQERSAELKLAQSKWQYAPSLNASAGLGYTFGRAIDFGTNSVSNDLQSTNFSIQASLSLFEGLGHYRTVQANKISRDVERASNESLRQTIELNVVSAYLQILYQSELLESQKHQRELTEQQLSIAREQANVGAIPQGSLLDIEAQLATENQRVVETENAIQLANIQLMQILDLRDENFAIVRPTISADNLPMLPQKTLQELYDEARAYYAPLREAELRKQLADKNIQIAYSRYSPRLTLGASYGSGSRHFLESKGHPTESPFMQQIKDNASQNVNLSLSIPIFNNFSEREGVNQAKIGLLQAQINEQKNENNLFKAIQQAYSDAVAALKRFQAAQQSYQSLEEAYRWAAEKYAIGATSAYEYSQAKTKFDQAEVSRLQSMYEYVFKTKILNFYRGLKLTL